jgi:glycosyltransferase involved in cell wall biosynthesis
MSEKSLVTVIIPTYNRFKFLLNAIKSVREQTYKNIEIIVVNDKSTEKEYYEYNFDDDITVLHLEKNSKELFGFNSPGGYARNEGMKIAKGEYIAFLDDDDYFFPTKIEKQIEAMKKYDCKVSCTDVKLGKGKYYEGKPCINAYYKGKIWNKLVKKFTKAKKMDIFRKMFSEEVNLWGSNELSVHNCTSGGSTMIIHKDIIKQVGYFPIMKFADDYKYWKKIVKKSKMLYLREHLAYLDNDHGYGKNYRK